MHMKLNWILPIKVTAILHTKLLSSVQQVLMYLVTDAVSIGSPLKLKYVNFLTFAWLIAK